MFTTAALLCIFGVAIILAIVPCIALRRGERLCDAAWEELKSERGRRHELIDRLLDKLGGNEDVSVLIEGVRAIREKCAREDATVSARGDAERQLTGAARDLASRVSAESSEGGGAPLRQMCEQIEQARERIGMAASFYNRAVDEHNSQARFFPSNVVARVLRFAPRERFEFEEREREA